MHGHLAHALENDVDDRPQPDQVLVFVQGPGRGGVDVLVQMAHQFPQRLERPGKLEMLELALKIGHGVVPDLKHLAIQILKFPALGHLSAKILVGHGQAARKEVAQVIGQISVETPHQGVLAERRILSEAHLRKQKIAKSAEAVLLGHVEGRDHVAQALGHLGLVHGPVAVNAQPFVERDAGGHEHGRPEHGMGLQDVLGHQMIGSGPVFSIVLAIGEAQRRDVVDERVEPDIGHKIAVKGQLDAPGQTRLGPGNAQVAQVFLEHGQDLVAVTLRLDEVRIGLDMLAQGLQILAHAEEIVLLLDEGRHGQVVRTLAVHQFLVRIEPLAPETIMPAVLVEINVALVEHGLQHVAHAGLVPQVRGADELVVAHFQHRPKILEQLADGVGIGLGVLAIGFGGLHDLVAVLIRAGQKKCRIPFETMKAAHAVGDDGRISVPQMGAGVHIIDGCGYEKRLQNGSPCLPEIIAAQVAWVNDPCVADRTCAACPWDESPCARAGGRIVPGGCPRDRLLPAQAPRPWGEQGQDLDDPGRGDQADCHASALRTDGDAGPCAGDSGADPGGRPDF